MAEATRSLSVRVFGVSRDIGLLPTRVHSDVRTTVLGLTRAVTERGKPIRLPDERAATVDAALRAGGIFGGGTAELAGCVSAWYIAQRAEGDADGINAYYDEFRAEGYTAALGGAQEELTHRCAELAGLPSAPTGAPPLVLDLGCGSGLSIGPLVRRGCAVIGIDLSLEMLRTARRAGAEVVQADMSQPLPLRTGLFDGLTSVSALQFLCEPVRGRSAEERLGTLFIETARVLGTAPELGRRRRRSSSSGVDGERVDGSVDATCSAPCAAFQFHPSCPQTHPTLIVRAARAAGCAAVALVDQPHRTSGRRWFVYVVPRVAEAPSAAAAVEPAAAGALSSSGGFAPSTTPCICRMHAPLRAACPLGGFAPSTTPSICRMHAPLRAACPLTLRAWASSRQLPVPKLDPAHEAWLSAEHVRWAHTQLRRLRRAEAEDAVAGARRGLGGHAEPSVADVADEIEAPPRDEACDEADESCASTGAGLMSAVTSAVAPPPPPSPHPQAHDQRRGEHGQRRRKRRKNKGFLAPGGAGDEWAMGLAECRAAAELRERLRVPAGECPSLEQLQRQLPELLSALHDPADSGSE
jgi:SAM-dependent methyltransferase